MKTSYFLIFSAFLFFSCASSQNIFIKEAEQKIEKLNVLLNLRPKQSRQLLKIETKYLSQKKEFENKIDRDPDFDINKILEKRNKGYKKVLSREQFIKFLAIENEWIKKVPVYSEE